MADNIPGGIIPQTPNNIHQLHLNYPDKAIYNCK